MSQRPLRIVPNRLILLAVSSLIVYLLVASTSSLPKPRTEPLEKPPAIEVLRLAGFGDNAFLSRLIVFWLQMHDYQAGVSLSYHDIDYSKLIEWLDLSISLDQTNEYPLLLASRVYGMVDDSRRQKLILDFVAEKFKEQPENRWPWMAHAVYMAKHRVKNDDLALEYARILASRTDSRSAPKWARQMHVFILADMGKVEAAKVLLGGLYESGQLKDEKEYRFLLNRIDEGQN